MASPEVEDMLIEALSWEMGYGKPLQWRRDIASPEMENRLLKALK